MQEVKGRRGKLENIKFRQASKKNSCCFMSCLLFSPLKLNNVEIRCEILNANFHSGVSFSQRHLLPLVTKRQLTLTQLLGQVGFLASVQ